MVMCNAIVVIEYDSRIAGLLNAPLDIEYDQQHKKAIASNMNMKHTIHISIH